MKSSLSETTSLLYFDADFQKHETGDHPENAARLTPSLARLQALARSPRYSRPDWRPALRSQLAMVHTDRHIDSIQRLATAGGGWIDQDTVVSRQSFEVALLAAGAVVDAVQRVHRDEARRAFCLVRPPGHHAASDHAAGFCLFNNIAIGARMAIRELGYERVLIVDWDVHHGDGTQAIFWEDPNVAYFSMHRDPFYPYTGNRSETGAGKGSIHNLPVSMGTSRQEIVARFDQELTGFASSVQPQLILISAGFDAHKDDPIGSLGLDTTDFAALTNSVVNLANQYANGRIISVLEGGYNPAALANCISMHLSALEV